MESLDHNNNIPDPDQVTPIRTGLKYGVILVAVGIIFQLFTNLIGLGGGFMMGTISLAMTIAVIVFAVRYHRDHELGGFISFRRGLAVSFWMGISYGTVVGIWVWVNNKFLTSEESIELQKRELDKIRAQVEDGEVPPEILTATEMVMDAMVNPVFMMTTALLSILFIGIFVSLFTKREPLTS